MPSAVKQRLGYFAAPVLIVALAVALGVWMTLPTQGNYVALETPMSLSVGSFEYPRFTAGYDDRYSVGVEMDEFLGDVFTGCTAGIEYPFHDRQLGHCIDSRLRLNWQLTEGGRLLTQGAFPVTGQSGASYGGNTITVPLGDFHLTPGHSYVLAVRNNQDVSALLPAHPKIIVAVGNEVPEGDMVMRTLAQFLFVCLGVVGAGWGLTAWVVYRRRHTGPGA